jgi:mono/diheme cytochrome c family protein
MRAALPLLIAIALAGCEAAPQVAFADASITLPDDPMDLPEGPGRQAVVDNCLACHSPSTMLQQPKVSREKWESIAGKMIEVYKAPVDPAAIPAIADYMVHVQTQPER